MFDYVGWCMSRNPNDLRCGLRIIDYIMGVAFAKLLLICGVYCKRNPVLNPTGEKYNLQGIEESIKTGTIELSCYIPK